MSREAVASHGRDGRFPSTPSGWTVEGVAGATAAAAVLAMAAARTAANAPVPTPIAASHGAFEVAALAVPAAAALAIGVGADHPLDRIGLTAVGVFGGLAAVAPAARLPAAGVVVAGGALAIAGRTATRTEGRRVLVAGAVLAAVVASLGGSIGLLPAPSRAVGSWLALAGLAAAPVLVRWDRAALLLGGATFAAVVVASAGFPFVTGAVVLVVVGSVGVPLLLVGLGVAGGVTAIAGAARSGRRTGAFGAICLLAAGVPATVPRALAVALGLALLLGGDRRD